MIFGGNGFGFGGRGGTPVTEADLCNANNFTQLQGAVGRLNDQLTNTYMGLQNGLSTIGYESLRNHCGLVQQIDNRFSEQARAQSECCCTTQRGIDGINYNAAINTAAINANTDAKMQKILDVICENKIEALQGKVSELQNQLNLCGVVRYPQYVTTTNPFFGGGCGCGNYNI